LYEAALRRLGVDPVDIAGGDARKLQDEDSGSRAGNGTGDALFDDGLEGVIDGLKSPVGVPGIDAGLLVIEEGKSRYLENNLWTSLRGEFRDSAALLEDSSDEEEPDGIEDSSPEMFSDAIDIILGFPRPGGSLYDFHPQPVQIFRLWQIFLDNVHPLVKVFHTPTVQQLILNSIGNLVALPKNLEALMFSLYCCALNSLSDSECYAILGQPKRFWARRFRTASHQALVNAGVLKSSNMMVLQAFVLYLVSFCLLFRMSGFLPTRSATLISVR
jgi:hypothetical protein